MKNLVSLISVVVLSVSVLASCGTKNAKNTPVEAAPEAVQVELAEARLINSPQTAEFSATVEADVVNKIAPAMAVRIDKIFVEVGQQVKAGQKLVQMESSSLIQAETQLKNLEADFIRIDELFKVGGVSRAEWDAKKTALEVSRTAFRNLQDNTFLTSPVSGVVTARNYDNGDMYAMANPILVVEQITPVKLLINVSESYYTGLKKGMPAEVKLDVYGEELFNGTVSLIYPSVDPTTRTIPVEVTLRNADQRVRPGMSATVVLHLGDAERVVVPDRAIVRQSGSGNRYVFLYDNGKVLFREITIGRRVDSDYEVISGLSAGDKVVVSGQNRLNEVTSVTVK